MENKSPGSGGGGGLTCITSTSNPTMNGPEKIGAVINGGSPDSTTPKDSNREERSAPSPAASVSDNHGGGGGGSAPNMYSLKWNTQLLSLQRSLANLWDSGIGTDAVLLCQGTPLPVHKIVLTAASPYVAAVVQTMAQGSHLMPVIVVDIPAEAGKALLSFLYCGEAHVPVTVIPHLVIGAKFLGISGFGDPGVLESLTSIVPESVMTPDKTPPPSCDSPRPDTDSPSIRLPHYQLPTVSVPHLMSSSSVQINNHTFGGKKSDRDSQIQYPGNVLQFKTHQHLQAQIGMGKARLPYPSPYSTSSTASSASSSGGEVINLSNNKNRTSGGSAYSPYSRSSVGAKSPKSTSSMSSGGSSNGNGLFIGTTSILDNLLKNPRTHLEAAIAAAAAAAQNAANGNNDSSDNNDMVQYEAEGFLENCRGSPHNLTAAHLRQLQEQHGKGQYFCSPGSAGHPALVGSNGGDDDNNNMEMTMTEDSTPIPAHLLEPNVEYHIGNEYPDRYGTLHNPLADLAKVAAASMKQQPATGGNKRGSKKAQQQQVDGNGEITSTGNTTTPPAKPKPKKNEAIICDICSKKFSNAYNLRVHMEGHSGQVFVCSVCSHASRSRDALRKHFAYRHRELWISGMSAFRKNVPGRKLSICRNNNNTDVVNNNTVNVKGEATESADGNSVVDANGNINIRGSDGTLTISEAK